MHSIDLGGCSPLHASGRGHGDRWSAGRGMDTCFVLLCLSMYIYMIILAVVFRCFSCTKVKLRHAFTTNTAFFFHFRAIWEGFSTWLKNKVHRSDAGSVRSAWSSARCKGSLVSRSPGHWMKTPWSWWRSPVVAFQTATLASTPRLEIISNGRRTASLSGKWWKRQNSEKHFCFLAWNPLFMAFPNPRFPGLWTTRQTCNSQRSTIPSKKLCRFGPKSPLWDSPESTLALLTSWSPLAADVSSRPFSKVFTV